MTNRTIVLIGLVSGTLALVPAASPRAAGGPEVSPPPTSSALEDPGAVMPMAIVGGTVQSRLLAFVDQATNAVIAQADPGADRSGAHVITPDGRRLLILSSRYLTLIDVATRAVLASVPVNIGISVAFSPEGSSAFLMLRDGTIEVRNAATLALERILATGIYPNYQAKIAVTPDGQELYVSPGHRTDVLSTSTGTLRATISFNGGTHGVTFTRAGTRAYAMTSNGEVVVIDTRSYSALTTIALPVPCCPRGVAVSPDGTRLYALGFSKLFVIDTSTDVIVHTTDLLPGGFDAHNSIAVSADGSRVFATGGDGNVLTVVETTNHTVIANVTIPARYSSVVAAPSRPAAGLYAEPALSVYGDGSAVLAAQLVKDGFGVGAKRIAFSLFGQSVGEAFTDANGIARLTVGLGSLPAQNYANAVVAAFAGDAETPAATQTASLRVYRATPSISWNPGEVQANTALGSAQLNASTTVPGTFGYSPDAGTVLGVGFHTLTTTFTPADTANYSLATATRSITVNLWTAASQPVVGNTFAGSNAVVIDPVRNRVYIRNSSSIDVHDGLTDALIGQIPLDIYPQGMALDLDGQRLLVTSASPSSVLRVYDAVTFAAVETIALPLGAYRIAVDGAAGMVWVGHGTGSQLSAIDLNQPAGTAGRVQTFPICAKALAVNASTGYVYAACYGQVLRAVDGDPSRPTFGQVVGSVEAGGSYVDLAVNPRRNEIYVTPATWNLAFPNEVAIIDGDPTRASFHTRIGTLSPANQPGPDPEYVVPVGIAVNPVNARIYLKSSDADWHSFGYSTLTVFDGASRETLSVTMLPQEQYGSPGPIAVNAVTNRVYLGGWSVTTVQDTVVEQVETPADAVQAPVTTAMTGVSLTFTDVTGGGQTSATPIDATAANLELPGQFSIEGAPAYEIQTTASFDGPLTLCFATAVDDPDVFASLVVLHGENGAWVPQTTTRDFAKRELCVTVSSLSPFAIARQHTNVELLSAFEVSRPIRGATAPLKVLAVDASGANVSMSNVAVRATQLIWLAGDISVPLADAGKTNREGFFKYDEALAGYIYNLDTRALAPGRYELRMRISGDQTTHAVQFEIR